MRTVIDPQMTFGQVDIAGIKLDRCPDHGIGGFKRYVALAVLARNVQRLGAVLKEKDARRRGPYKKAA